MGKYSTIAHWPLQHMNQSLINWMDFIFHRYASWCSRYLSFNTTWKASDDVQCHTKQRYTASLQEIYARCNYSCHLVSVCRTRSLRYCLGTNHEAIHKKDGFTILSRGVMGWASSVSCALSRGAFWAVWSKCLVEKGGWLFLLHPKVFQDSLVLSYLTSNILPYIYPMTSSWSLFPFLSSLPTTISGSISCVCSVGAIVKKCDLLIHFKITMLTIVLEQADIEENLLLVMLITCY